MKRLNQTIQTPSFWDSIQEFRTNKAFQLAESGRSMVEMLGVLAIIGVLSVGAVVGYKYATSKHVANTIMSELNLRAVPLSQIRIQNQMAAGTTLHLEAGDKIASGHTISAKVSINPEYFEMTVNGVQQQSCEMILEDYITSSWITVNNTLYENTTSICNAEENDMTFVYSNNLGERRTCSQKGLFNVNSYKCECDGGTYFDNGKKDCACPAGHVWSDTERKCIESRCQEGEFETLSNGCVPCDDTEVYTINKNDPEAVALCNACSGRAAYSKYCALKCPKDTIFSKIYGCIPCTDSIDGYTYITDGNKVQQAECQACSSGRLEFMYHCVSTKYCTKNQYLGMLSGSPKCYDCDAENNGASAITTQEEIDQCNSCVTSDGTKMRAVINNQCKKILCSEHEFKGIDGGCYSCTYPNSVEVSAQSDCATICTNRKIENGYCKISECTNGILFEDGTCQPCDTRTAFPATEEQCNSCKDTNGNRIRGWLDTGLCRLNLCTLGQDYPESTSTLEGYWATTCTPCKGRDGSDGAGIVGFSEYTKTYCEACSGNYVGSDGYCYYGNSCNRGSEFRSGLKSANWTHCISCDYTEKVKMANHEEHDKMCADCTTTPRFFAKDYCYRCDSNEAPVVTTSEERASCTACPNRQINADNQCVLIKTEE